MPVPGSPCPHLPCPLQFCLQDLVFFECTSQCGKEFGTPLMIKGELIVGVNGIKVPVSLVIFIDYSGIKP